MEKNMLKMIFSVKQEREKESMFKETPPKAPLIMIIKREHLTHQNVLCV